MSTRAPDRYVVVNMSQYRDNPACTRKIYTSYGDAAKITQRCSRNKKKPCFLMQGWPGAEKIVGRCENNKCGKPKEGDRAMLNRCGISKKSRRDLIAASARKSKGLSGRRRRKAKR